MKHYNLPVRVWLSRAFPKEKPWVEIQPGPDMTLEAVNYVDGEGRVSLPYLNEWKEVRESVCDIGACL